MKAVKVLLVCHVAAIVFGLAGLLIALPHPELWAGSPTAADVFAFGIRYAGSMHILFGAATMLLFGVLTIGPRKTAIFFAASTIIALCMELLGTGTGFPFGAYSYTDFLGFKIGGRVPYAIPLSWFYMGSTSYLLASLIVQITRWRRPTLWSLALGAYFLTIWDLALDPAMANMRLPVHFWIWYQTGPYFGMPIRNLVGWALTGLLFMTSARLLWRTDLSLDRVRAWLPFIVYAANSGFAIALSLSAGLWLPPIMAIALGVAPAGLALRARSRSGGLAEKPGAVKASPQERIVQFVIRTGARRLLARDAHLDVEGLEHVPASGPALIVSRHVHHLYDGCAFMVTIPRRARILVALDWVRGRCQRRLMERACAAARWPVVLRPEGVTEGSAYALHESRHYLRRGAFEAVRLLRSGELLVIFPEAYPNVDPAHTPKQGLDDFLPFRPGFTKLVDLAQRDGRTRVAVVPAGLRYEHAANARWQITLRFGPALYLDHAGSTDALAAALELQVRALSAPSPIDVAFKQEVISR